MAWWDTYQTQKDTAKQANQAALQAAVQDPLKDIPGASDPGPLGMAGRFLGGMVQGEVDPEQGASELVGMPLPKSKQLEAVANTPMGRAGRLTGNIVNPLWELGRGVDLATGAAKYAGPVLHGIAHLLGNTAKGAGAGALMPGEDRGKQAEIGGVIGSILGLPGGLSRALSYRDVPALLRAVESHAPQWVSRSFDAARQLSIPSFNRAWSDYVMQPLGLRAPLEVGRKGIQEMGDKIGKALDNATAGMTLDATAGTPAQTALGRAISNSTTNLASTGNAARTFNRILNQTVNRPLAFNMGKLSSRQLQDIASNLKTEIDNIRPFSQENRALKSELENFRQTLFDQASGTPEQKAAYQAARTAWSRFAPARDALTPTEETFSPAQIMQQIDRRYPFDVPRGTAPGQDVAEAGQRALLLPGRAASRVVAGKSPAPQSIVPLVPGLGAASTRNWSPTGGVAP